MVKLPSPNNIAIAIAIDYHSDGKVDWISMCIVTLHLLHLFSFSPLRVFKCVLK